MNAFDNRLAIVARLAAQGVRRSRLRVAEAPTLALPFGCTTCGSPGVQHAPGICKPFVSPVVNR